MKLPKKRRREIALDYATIVVGKNFHMIHYDFEAAINQALDEQMEADKTELKDVETNFSRLHESSVKTEAELVKMRDELDKHRKALYSAKLFISNGIEFGYISMPDDGCPDPAHKTLPLIESVLSGWKPITPPEE